MISKLKSIASLIILRRKLARCYLLQLLTWVIVYLFLDGIAEGWVCQRRFVLTERFSIFELMLSVMEVRVLKLKKRVPV